MGAHPDIDKAIWYMFCFLVGALLGLPYKRVIWMAFKLGWITGRGALKFGDAVAIIRAYLHDEGAAHEGNGREDRGNVSVSGQHGREDRT